MLFRLKTVRGKLTALVLLSAVVMLAALPVLSWLLHRQLVDEVDDRVTDAERAFQTELDDDIADLTLASRVLAADGATARAIQKKDPTRARDLAQVFLSVYPDIDILIVEADGTVLAQVGCDHPPAQLGSGPDFADLAQGREMRGVVEHGCESGATDAPPAYVIGVPIAGVGGVVVCQPLDADYLKNASAKLGLQLALAVLKPGDEHRMVGSTPQFPQGALGVSSPQSTIIDAGDRSWAVARFEPRQLEGRIGKVGMLAALDVTDIRLIVKRNLFYALGILLVAALVSVFFGSRLASVMSGALRRVNTALKRIELLDYVHVEAVHTGDELEDLATGFNTMVDGLKERDELREREKKLGKYMTASIMEHVLAGKVQLGGESLRVTILFTDIRSFTTISEKMDPQRLVGLLNEYFTEMVGIVMEQGGIVDKYIGDAIMVVFGAPVPKPEQDAANAMRAAVRMRKALQELNHRLEARGMQALRTGIGIHTGEVVAGNIGHDRRMEYTVIGDAVNLASRLETNTKDLGCNVLISEDTYELVKDVVEVRAVREITVKGRRAPVMTYEVLGLKGEPLLEASESTKIARASQPAPPAGS
jgi:adenylate cyclase